MDTFVLSQTRLIELNLGFGEHALPSIRLHLADEVIPVWQRSERDAPPFWAFAWPGGQALARYILDHPDLVRGKRVLDVASGSGLVAIAAALCGACVTATDIDPYAIAAITLNAQANNVEVRAHLGDVLDSRPQVDVVLAGDVFYSREMARRVREFLARSGAGLILVGDPGRAYAPTSGFERIAEYDVPVNGDVEDADLKRAHVLRAVTQGARRADVTQLG